MFVFSIIKKSATRDEREAILHEGSVMKEKKGRREGEGEEGTTAGLSNSVAQCLQWCVCLLVYVGVSCHKCALTPA